MGYLHNFRVTPHKILLVAKGKWATFHWRNLADTTLINRINQNQVPTFLDTMKRIQHHFNDIPAKEVQPESNPCGNMKLILSNILQVTDL